MFVADMVESTYFVFRNVCFLQDPYDAARCMQQTLCDETFAFLQDPNDTETFRNFCKIVIMQLGVCSRQKGFPPEMHPVSSSGMQVKTQTSVIYYLDFYRERRKSKNTDFAQQPTDSEGDSQARGIQLLRSLPRTAL